VGPVNRTRYYFTNRGTRFLRDLKKTATLTGREKVAAGAVGVLVPGIFTGSSLTSLVRKKSIRYSSPWSGVYVSDAIKKSMKSKKSKPVGELIDNWNYVRLAELNLAYSR
jgi:Domain of unknown function (DUF4646)